MRSASKTSPETGAFTLGWSQRQLELESHTKMFKYRRNGVMRHRNRNLDGDHYALHSSAVPSLSKSAVSLSSSSVSSSESVSESVPPKETELLNYLLRADLAAIEAVVNHPFVEAFVHLKWLSVRKVFFLLRSLYLFLISLYTFYVFDTFVHVTCFYNVHRRNGTSTSNTSSVITAMSVEQEVKITGRDKDNDTVEKVAFGFFSPSASITEDLGGVGKQQQVNGNGYREWSSFSEYFKAHEMSCEPTTRTTVLAYLFAAYAIWLVLYELYKLCESRYDYFKTPINYAWWILAVNIGISLSPGLGVYAHTWHYPHAAFTLAYGWILMLAQVTRIPYFGIFVGIFVKVVKDFCLLLFTFSPVLLGFALGFSVMLPQNEFFRFIPLGLFKVFLMMTGDVDFWGVFSGTWTSSTALKGHLHFPLFVMYSVYILIVTMVLMSLLLGLAVENIQEVRREAALHRTVELIQEIGIFESILHKPTLYYCGCARYLRRLLSITSLDIMNGPELIIFPENPKDTTLPSDIKQKLVPYLLTSCCCPDPIHNHHRTGEKNGLLRKVGRKGGQREKNLEIRKKVISEEHSTPGPLNEMVMKRENKSTSNEMIRKLFFQGNHNTNAHVLPVEPNQDQIPVPNRERARRDLEIYQEVKSLLDDNEKLRARLENLQRKLTRRDC